MSLFCVSEKIKSYFKTPFKGKFTFGSSFLQMYEHSVQDLVRYSFTLGLLGYSNNHLMQILKINREIL